MTGLPPARVAESSTAYDEARIIDGTVLWLESRPDGRDVLIRAADTQEVLTGGYDVASYVHEYGGGAWTVHGDTAWFSAADQGLYRASPTGIRGVISAPGRRDGDRYGDLCAGPDGGELWAVRERREQHQVINELVRIGPVDGPVVQAVAAGRDFYAFPRPSPDGRSLAWTCWDEPLMPWDGTFLYVAGIGADGSLGDPALVAGGMQESVFQPQWSPGGVLHFISDRDGWWNLYAWRDDSVVPVLTCDAELGVAQWEFGYSTYAFLSEERIAVIAQHGSRQELRIIADGQSRPLDLPFTSFKPYLSASGNKIAFIGSAPQQAPAVFTMDVDSGEVRRLAGAGPVSGAVSIPEPFVFAARDGQPVHGLFYPPWETRGAPPPLVVKAHPGPTANVNMRLDWHTQFLCSHGFAVAEIDYRGSTGYGRAYRNALRGQWGEGDALDCAEAVEYLASRNRSEPRRTVIWGASAGGYTALRAVILTGAFAGCIARSPVIDPRTWSTAAPKFQARQADLLIGTWPGHTATYRARSVLGNAGAIRCPVLLLHGELDPVTPASETRELAKALPDLAELEIFPGQGHGFRSPQALTRALNLELAFLRGLTETEKES
jgi:dipeptidyl aminopeptidase/acylaminoacyl peptidase